jgi:imidazolonepropionase
MEAATQDIISHQIPALYQHCLEGEVSVDNIDVFCEKGVFDVDASRRILRAGQEVGWKANFHGDELHSMNSGEVSWCMYDCNEKRSWS